MGCGSSAQAAVAESSSVTNEDSLNIVKNVLAAEKKLNRNTSLKHKQPVLIEVTPTRPKVLIIHTGGTFAMRPNRTTGSLDTCPGYLQQTLKEFSELRQPEMPLYEVKEYSPLIDSSCMEQQHWVKIATDIEENYLDYTGFVVIMGTDTISYAASALSFMLENLGKTVVFTGSMIPLCMAYNDSRRNLIVSMIFASQCEYPEVCIFFHNRLMRANRTTKINSFGVDAFSSPNFEPLAVLEVNIRHNDHLTLPQPRAPFRVHKKLESHIVTVRLTPGLDEKIIRHLIEAEGLRALVLEIFGTGNAPSDRPALLEALALAKKRGVLVVATTQCLHGSVIFDAYEAGRVFGKTGVLSAGDMTTEAVVTKLAYLFGKLGNKEEVAARFEANLRGEISDMEIYKKGLVTKESLLVAYTKAYSKL